MFEVTDTQSKVPKSFEAVNVEIYIKTISLCFRNWSGAGRLWGGVFVPRNVDAVRQRSSGHRKCEVNLRRDPSTKLTHKLSLLISDTLHLWPGLRNWFGKDVPLLLPKTQSESVDRIFRWHRDSFIRMAVGGNDCGVLRILSSIQVRETMFFFDQYINIMLNATSLYTAAFSPSP
jgi:hypothetical protein